MCLLQKQHYSGGWLWGGLGAEQVCGCLEQDMGYFVCHELKDIGCYPQWLSSSGLYLAQYAFSSQKAMLSMELLLLCSGLAIMWNKKNYQSLSSYIVTNMGRMKGQANYSNPAKPL